MIRYRIKDKHGNEKFKFEIGFFDIALYTILFALLIRIFRFIVGI